MRQWMRTKRLTIAFLLLLPVAAVSAETMADIDADIQTNKTFKTDRGGLAAYNIYEGVTTSRLDRKIAILKAAGVSKWFYQYGSGATNYENFHSFTSLSGVTDTAVALITPSDNLRLYRRGKTGTIETSTRLGAWWSPAYRGVEATRNDLAVLKAWGSDFSGFMSSICRRGIPWSAGWRHPWNKAANTARAEAISIIITARRIAGWYTPCMRRTICKAMPALSHPPRGSGGTWRPMWVSSLIGSAGKTAAGPKKRPGEKNRHLTESGCGPSAAVAAIRK